MRQRLPVHGAADDISHPYVPSNPSHERAFPSVPAEQGSPSPVFPVGRAHDGTGGFVMCFGVSSARER
jgi:hypothetical protein